MFVDAVAVICVSLPKCLKCEEQAVDLKEILQEASGNYHQVRGQFHEGI